MRLFILFLIVLANSAAQAHSRHSANVCAQTAPMVCAHVGYDGVLNTAQPAAFMLHFLPVSANPTINLKLVKNVAVQLWMDMGAHSHPGAPVSLTQVDEVHYQIKDAYFSMTGPWQIRVSFEYAGAKHLIALPVNVQ